jgi:hypothetical protein
MEMKISTPERNWNYSHFLTTGALGYVFTPPCSPEYPMYRQLDVNLHAQPTERHYDPEVVRFKVTSPIWGTEWLKVRHLRIHTPFQSFHSIGNSIFSRSASMTIIRYPN